jgi:hypothetical protein
MSMTVSLYVQQMLFRLLVIPLPNDQAHGDGSLLHAATLSKLATLVVISQSSNYLHRKLHSASVAYGSQKEH